MDKNISMLMLFVSNFNGVEILVSHERFGQALIGCKDCVGLWTATQHQANNKAKTYKANIRDGTSTQPTTSSPLANIQHIPHTSHTSHTPHSPHSPHSPHFLRGL